MRSVFTVVILLLVHASSYAITYFIASNGEDANDGLSLDFPFATIAHAYSVAVAGDTLLLTPGTYPGTTTVENKLGAPDQPIVLKSWAANPLDFAVIDGGSLPSQQINQSGLHFKNCAWLTIENIVFRNCWRQVIDLEDSAYITVRACHFSSGKEVVYPHGDEAHHILVEHCYVHHPEEVWQGWTWEDIHHGSQVHYNGGLLHPRASGGGHVLRANTGINLFNAFRTRPNNIQQDGNTEIYNNTFINIRDNEFEPEDWAWNMYYHHNWHRNVHKAYSIDDVRGGNIYIFGNTYTQEEDSYTRSIVNGIFKYKDGPLTYPCYAFNNSYYTEARVLKDGEATNHLLKHFNNAYYFFRGSQRFTVDEWQPGYEFDFDLTNQDFPATITNNQQEANGLENTDAQFMDGPAGDFRLLTSSPAIDAGKIMALPELDWTQDFVGSAPDIGAYEGDQRMYGPAFRFVPSPAGALYDERPRISQHRVDSNTLILFFSAGLDSSSLLPQFMDLYQSGMPVVIDTFYFPNHSFELWVETSIPLQADSLSLVLHTRPVGLNGLPLTDWASTLPLGTQVPAFPDLSIIPTEFVSSVNESSVAQELALVVAPNPSQGGRLTFTLRQPGADPDHTPEMLIYSTTGVFIQRCFPTSLSAQELRYEIGQRLPSGIYVGTVRTSVGRASCQFVVQ